MQPCAVCGGVVVDAAGYCVQCGTFRGAPAPPTGPPAGLPPYLGQVPPPQQPPYGGGPVSTPPAYLGPTSGPPGYPTSPAYYPAVAAPPAPKQRSPFVIPLLALSGTLVILVVAIVTVVLIRSNKDPLAGPGPGATGATSAASTVDSCVVGRWRVTSHEERVALDGVGNVTFTGGDGARLRLNADGTGVTDYGSGTEFEGTVNGREVTLVLSGTVSFRFHTANGTVSFSDTSSKATGVVKVDGEEIGREPFEASDDPAKYTCSGTQLTESTNLYEVVMARET